MSKRSRNKTLSQGREALASPLSEDLGQLLAEALAFHRRGEWERAQYCYEQLLQKKPRHFDALQLLGTLFGQRQQYVLAITVLKKALNIDATHAVTHYNLALAYQYLKQWNEAEASYRLATQHNPLYAEAYNNWGNVKKSQGVLPEAMVCYQHALAINPTYSEAYFNQGIALRELGQLAGAIASYDKALWIQPEYAQAHGDRAIALQQGLQWSQAKIGYERSIALKPEDAKVVSNYGVLLQELQQLERALSSYDKAIRIDPQYAESYWNKSLLELLQGHYEAGFLLYEWRWQREGFTSPKRNFLQPLWLGRSSLKNQTILLHAEQGLGDTIQFCRFVPFVKALGARVILEVPRELERLMRTLEGVDQWVIQYESLPAFDCHCPLMSLPLALNRMQIEAQPLQKYLAIEALRHNHWMAQLGEKKRPRLGFVWRGNKNHKNDLNRSIRLSDLVSWFDLDVEWVCLQKDISSDELAWLKRHTQCVVLDLVNADFAETAALLANLDLLICVDTSVAHLAGALGLQAWVLLPYVPDWRWLLDRTDCVWYSSLTLYRQSTRSDWSTVLETVAVDIGRLCEGGQRQHRAHASPQTDKPTLL